AVRGAGGLGAVLFDRLLRPVGPQTARIRDADAVPAQERLGDRHDAADLPRRRLPETRRTGRLLRPRHELHAIFAQSLTRAASGRLCTAQRYRIHNEFLITKIRYVFDTSGKRSSRSLAALSNCGLRDYDGEAGAFVGTRNRRILCSKPYANISPRSKRVTPRRRRPCSLPAAGSSHHFWAGCRCAITSRRWRAHRVARS